MGGESPKPQTLNPKPPEKEIAQVAAAIEEASEQGDLRDIDVSCSGVPAESVIPVGSDLHPGLHRVGKP